MHLRFDLLFQRQFAAFENFMDVRPQFARLGIDDRELLLDAERVDVRFLPPCRILMFSQNQLRVMPGAGEMTKLE